MRGGELDVAHTVNSPVTLSMETWVTCIGLVGVEMVGRLGEEKPEKRLEKAPFFLPPSDFLLEALLVVSCSSE